MVKKKNVQMGTKKAVVIKKVKSAPKAKTIVANAPKSKVVAAKVIVYPKALTAHRKTQTAAGWKREKMKDLKPSKPSKNPAKKTIDKPKKK